MEKVGLQRLKDETAERPYMIMHFAEAITYFSDLTLCDL